MGEIIGLDTMIFVFLIEENSEFVDRVERILEPVEAGRGAAVFSSLGLIELLAGPKKQGRYDLAQQYRDLIFRFPNLTVMGMNRAIIELASDLRARYNIATPDAIHLATAIDFGAEKFITNDQGLKRIKEIMVETL